MSSNTLKWPLVKLSTLAAKDKNAIVGGPFGSDLISRDYVPEGVPVVRGGNLPKNSNFSCEDFVFVSERKADSLHWNCAKPGDIVFTQRGTLGQVGIVPKNTPYSRFLVSQSQMKMTVDSLKADAFYLYYYFRLPSTVSYIENHALQSGVPHINLGILRKFDVVYPPLPIQKKIAAVLSAYDDLIENNKRRVALLEKIAEEIYREWFVRLRFPGHGNVKVMKGVPIDWNYDKASAFFSVVKGKSYGGDEVTENPSHMPFITLKSFNRGGGYREDGLKYYSGRYKEDQIVRTDDIVMAVTDMTQNREVVGRVAKVPNLGDRGAVISLDVIKIVPKKTTGAFLYSYLRFSGFAESIKEFANGANVLHLKPDLVPQQKIYIPPMPIQEAFSQIVKPFYTQIDLLSDSIKRMTETRDMLLPRMISGKLSVENLDIQFPPSMQAEAAS